MGATPVFEGETVLFSRSAVLGNCHVGRNVVFVANSFVLNTDIPANSTVVGMYPNHRILPNKGRVIEFMFNQQ